MSPSALEIDQDELWPRDDTHRFRVYSTVAGELVVRATSPTASGIGVALVTLYEDGDPCIGPIGVLDTRGNGPLADTGVWIVNPYQRVAR